MTRNSSSSSDKSPSAETSPTDALSPEERRALGPHSSGQAWLHAPENATLRVATVFFIIASLSHLWLGDAAQPDWYLANAIYIAGLITLCVPGRFANPTGWLLSALGLAIPLLFHRDQLTQSMILLIMSATAAATLGYDGWKTSRRLRLAQGIPPNENPGEIRPQHDAWHHENPGEIRPQHGARHHENSDEIRPEHGAWHHENPGEIRSQHDARHHENPGEIRPQHDAWHHENPGEIRPQHDARHHENPGEIHSRHDAWHHENTDEIRPQRDAWHHENPDEIRLQHGAWHHENPDEIRPEHGAWHHENPQNSGICEVGGENMRAGVWVCLRVFQGVTITTYLLAVLHKLNREFFRPAYSCATYGVEGLFDYWQLNPAWLPDGWQAWAPWWVLAGEGGIAALYLLGRRRVAWPVALAFHIPLTLVMAPAFAFVMLVGHAAFLRPADIERFRSVGRQYGLWLGGGACLATAVSVGMHGGYDDWTMIPREWLLWVLLGLSLAALFSNLRVGLPAQINGEQAARDDKRVGKSSKNSHITHLSTRFQPSRRMHLAAAAVVGVFLINGLTPYLGVQYQHAGAMVSGLRIDEGCWNSLVFPESVRIREDYLRIDTVYMREPGHIPHYEEIVREQLWSPPQLRQMQRNWCRPHIRPFYLAGTFRERSFEIADLCDEEAELPFEDDGVLGREIFPGYLRFQKNLSRQCPQTCIH